MSDPLTIKDLRVRVATNTRTGETDYPTYAPLTDAEFAEIARREGWAHKNDRVDVRMLYAYEAGVADVVAKMRQDGWVKLEGIDVEQLQALVRYLMDGDEGWNHDVKPLIQVVAALDGKEDRDPPRQCWCGGAARDGYSHVFGEGRHCRDAAAIDQKGRSQ